MILLPLYLLNCRIAGHLFQYECVACGICCVPRSSKNRPLSVNSQSGRQNNKIALHLIGFVLSGNRTTIVLSSRLGITEMGLYRYNNTTVAGYYLFVFLSDCVHLPLLKNVSRSILP